MMLNTSLALVLTTKINSKKIKLTTQKNLNYDNKLPTHTHTKAWFRRLLRHLARNESGLFSISLVAVWLSW